MPHPNAQPGASKALLAHLAREANVHSKLAAHKEPTAAEKHNALEKALKKLKKGGASRKRKHLLKRLTRKRK
jgi:hypothetical protein